MDAKRLLLLNYEFPPLGGGASPVSFELARELISKHHCTIDVVTMGYRDLPRVDIPYPGLTVYRVPCLRRHKSICFPHEQATYLLSAFFQCLKLIRRHHYSLCHAHFLIPTGALAFLLKLIFRLDYIVTSHGSDVPGFNSDRFTLLHRLTKPFLYLIATHSRAVITPSIYLQSLITTRISSSLKSKLIHIPNGIDIKKFQPQPKQNYIFASGRFLERKGFQHLIKAVADEKLPLEVHLAGSGPYESKLKKLADSSKTKIIFHGWLNNNSQKYKDLLERASIYCLLSESENASIALLEAMSAGCAIITASGTGTAETISNSGLVVKWNSTKQIKNGINQLIRNPKKIKHYGTLARERIIKTYDIEIIGKQYHQIISKHSK